MIYYDVSHVMNTLDGMAKKLRIGEFDKRMRSTLKDTAKQVYKDTKKEIKKQYYAPPSFVNKAIKRPVIRGGGSDLRAEITTIGTKGSVGGTFAAQGGHYGWNPPAYSIKAKILRSGVSTLPATIKPMGGQPPFRNMGGGGKMFIGKKTKLSEKRLKNMKFSTVSNGGAMTLVYTRKFKEKNPYYTHAEKRVTYNSVKGLAVAQMIENRARAGIENDIRISAEGNVTANFSDLF